ncbi:stage II sporulation protein D [Virgibacillus sp. W0181]|uniref:stage II sporulation protein D n=1 Tax=Virgibacillus sp. W0181 TaxID=3391581 RepID=UPI003F47AEDA
MKHKRHLLKKHIRPKKKSTLLERAQEKQKRRISKVENTKRGNTQPLKPRNGFSQLKSSWKLPAILFVSVLVIIIVVVPTLIVIPFIKDGNQQVVPTEQEAIPTVKQADSPFSVAVMRSVSDEIEDVPLETYVTRVVASEMPAEFEVEALKAQALAARTYIVNHLMHNEADVEPDVTDTTKHQVYQNETELRERWGSDFDWKMEKVRNAVYATQGEILTHNQAPITPAFFSTSNGFTENSEDYWENELPYLRSVESSWDKDSPKYLDQKVFSIQKVEESLQVDLPEALPMQAAITRTESGRVAELTLADHTISGRDVREKLDLRSSDFSIEQKNGHFVFTTKGYGHGVGMSQYGANGMAKEGQNYKNIVSYYYQGVEVSNVDEIAPTLVSK